MDFLRILLEDSADSQKMHLEWTSVWRAKCMDFHRILLSDSADSQKMHLAWTSVWRAKCMDFNRIDAFGQRGFAKNAPRLDLSMESNMYGFP